GQLRGLARAGLAADHDQRVPLERRADLLAACAHRKRGVEADFAAHRSPNRTRSRAQHAATYTATSRAVLPGATASIRLDAASPRGDSGGATYSTEGDRTAG